MTIGLRYPPFVRPGERASQSLRPTVQVEEDLPSIDQFIDDLPLIDDFLSTEADADFSQPADEVFAAAPDSIEMPVALQRPSEEGWADGDWQSYDWGSLASLNRHVSAGAVEAWGETEWPAQPTATGNEGSGTPNADEIADALDGMARRIRSGELMINNLSGTPPEAAMAAALAVILKMRG